MNVNNVNMIEVLIVSSQDLWSSQKIDLFILITAL